MVIKKKRIRSFARHFRMLKPNEKYVVGVRYTRERAIQAGFKDAMEGDALLPASVGPVTRFNAEGRYVKRRDLPMETAYAEIEWTYHEYHGRDRVAQTKYAYRPYERYQRTFIPPPGVELTIATDTSGTRVIVAPLITNTSAHEALAVHVTNVLLELFGGCEVFTENLQSIIAVPVRRLNWTVLPKGHMPWGKLRGQLDALLKRQPDGRRAVIQHRLETINDLKPDFVAVGEAGFDGYVVFGFEKKDTFILESVHPDNATYVFDKDWQQLSRLTKAEILDAKLQKDRVIHREGWATAVRGFV